MAQNMIQETDKTTLSTPDAQDSVDADTDERFFDLCRQTKREGVPKIFISYANASKAARTLIGKLFAMHQACYHFFIDKEMNNAPMEEFRQRINQEMNHCDGAIIFLCEIAVQSPEVQHEASVLCSRRLGHASFPLLVIRIGIENDDEKFKTFVNPRGILERNNWGYNTDRDLLERVGDFFLPCKARYVKDPCQHDPILNTVFRLSEDIGTIGDTTYCGASSPLVTSPLIAKQSVLPNRLNSDNSLKLSDLLLRNKDLEICEKSLRKLPLSFCKERLNKILDLLCIYQFDWEPVNKIPGIVCGNPVARNFTMFRCGKPYAERQIYRAFTQPMEVHWQAIYCFDRYPVFEQSEDSSSNSETNSKELLLNYVRDKILEEVDGSSTHKHTAGSIDIGIKKNILLFIEEQIGLTILRELQDKFKYLIIVLCSDGKNSSDPYGTNLTDDDFHRMEYERDLRKNLLSSSK